MSCNKYYSIFNWSWVILCHRGELYFYLGALRSAQKRSISAEMNVELVCVFISFIRADVFFLHFPCLRVIRTKLQPNGNRPSYLRGTLRRPKKVNRKLVGLVSTPFGILTFNSDNRTHVINYNEPSRRPKSVILIWAACININFFQIYIYIFPSLTTCPLYHSGTLKTFWERETLFVVWPVEEASILFCSGKYYIFLFIPWTDRATMAPDVRTSSAGSGLDGRPIVGIHRSFRNTQSVTVRGVVKTFVGNLSRI